MKIIAGIDIGNCTTEACLAVVDERSRLAFLESALVKTTGIKGSIDNVDGVVRVLQDAAKKSGIDINEISSIFINEAAPVIGATAMETITETLITDSIMLGHNPHTPAGVGTAAGFLIDIGSIENCETDKPYIVTASSAYAFKEIAGIINRKFETIAIKAVMLQSDEAVLVYNRLDKKIPIIDEVLNIQSLENDKFAAVEVAPIGETVKMLSNPYGIATLLNLSPMETKRIVPIAKSLIGNRSAAVVKMPHRNSSESMLESGKIIFVNQNNDEFSTDMDKGADEIMKTLEHAGEIEDIHGQENTSIGNMFMRVKAQAVHTVKIKDIVAVDTSQMVEVAGDIVGGRCLEKAVGIAAMVKTEKLPMQKLAQCIQEKLGIYVKVAGVEAVMAALGALTTPGVELPIAILDLGGGSTDAAVLDENGTVKSIQLAGAGELVTLLIHSELGLNDMVLAENIKKYPLAKVESLFHMRLETGETVFFEQPLNPRIFGKVVLLIGNEFVAIEHDIPMERIAFVRREAKKKVFVKNAYRAIRKLTSNNLNIHEFTKTSIILVGGSAEDFEIPHLLTEAFYEYGVVCGRGNIRRKEGARNAVATGLIMHTNSV